MARKKYVVQWGKPPLSRHDLWELRFLLGHYEDKLEDEKIRFGLDEYEKRRLSDVRRVRKRLKGMI